jgi:formamidase
MKSIEIDRTKQLRDEPDKGHNRFHPDLPAILEVDEGEEVVLDTRDGIDGQLGPTTTEADFATFEAGLVHPLTGPIYIKGAQPGDLLEIEYLDIIPQPQAFSAILPGLGFLRDVYAEPFLVQWQLRDGWATSPQLPGVRIPGAPFMGISAVAPSHEQLQAWMRREQNLIDSGGLAFPPDVAGAVPHSGPAATTGLRTVPPRENGGNFDVKQLTKGARVSAFGLPS